MVSYIKKIQYMILKCCYCNYFSFQNENRLEEDAIAGKEGYKDISVINSDNFTTSNYDTRSDDFEMEPYSYIGFKKKGKQIHSEITRLDFLGKSYEYTNIEYVLTIEDANLYNEWTTQLHFSIQKSVFSRFQMFIGKNR